MTGLLKEAFDRVSKLPETLQDNIAKEILAELEKGKRDRPKKLCP